KPKDHAELGRSRVLFRDERRGDIAEGILAAVKNGMNCPESDLPRVDRSREKLQVNPALADLLRVLLKTKTASVGVASKLVAPASDLDAIAAGERDVSALQGWRFEVFGEDALKLCDGKIALAAKGNDVMLVPV
ncbi:MAG: ribonuclease D, partial [Planktotalea arctica]